MVARQVWPLQVWQSGTNENSLPANDNALTVQVVADSAIDFADSEPMTPSEDDQYVIGTAWGGFTENNVVIYKSGTWLEFEAFDGWLKTVDNTAYVFDGTIWAELSSGASVAWGSITGTIATQTDLQLVLDAKFDAADVSAFGESLINDADSAAARTTLGLGSAATESASAFATSAQGAKADGAVQSVVAGTNVTVDNTDPDNPVISATGGGGGSGDVVGPASSVNGRVATFDGTTGKLLADGGVLLTALAPLASPTFTGTPAAPTASAGTSTTQVATTAFVNSVAVQDTASAATVTPTFLNDMVTIRAQAANLTLANWSGTAKQGWGIVIRVKDNGTTRTITYGSNYRAASGVTLPTATTPGQTIYLCCIYNSTDTKIDVMSVGTVS